MSLAIVAIPREDDFVWNISSEKVPHLTILSLGDDVSEADTQHIVDFVEYASSLMAPFGMDVDYRGELGEKEADVLFFNKEGWSFDRINNFRSSVLQDLAVKTAFRTVDQFPEWTPHLTLGYPETPAKKDTRDYPGIQWMTFDKIAVWTSNYEGPTFRLKAQHDEVIAMSFTQIGEEFIAHHGVKGMRWGVRRSKRALERERKRSEFESRRSEDSKRHTTNAKKHPSELSDKDLKDLHNRLNTEKNVRQLQAEGERSANRTLKDLNRTNSQLVALGLPSLAIVSKAAAKPVIALGAIVAGTIVARSALQFLPDGKLPVKVK